MYFTTNDENIKVHTYFNIYVFWEIYFYHNTLLLQKLNFSDPETKGYRYIHTYIYTKYVYRILSNALIVSISYETLVNVIIFV